MEGQEWKDLEQFARDLREEAGGWESDTGADEDLQGTQLEDILNKIRNLAEDLLVEIMEYH
jgi:hypothetical protein